MKRFPVWLVGLAILAAVCFAYAGNARHHGSGAERELRKIEVSGIRFFMTRAEVEAMHGAGPDKTPGCFGCEMNFIYPKLKLSGRYSETWDQMKGRYIDESLSPKVKSLTIADPKAVVFGIRIGDTMWKAGEMLRSKGFVQNGNEFSQDRVSIRLWSDGELNLHNKPGPSELKNNDIVRSITIDYLVPKDEEIVY